MENNNMYGAPPNEYQKKLELFTMEAMKCFLNNYKCAYDPQTVASFSVAQAKEILKELGIKQNEKNNSTTD